MVHAFVEGRWVSTGLPGEIRALRQRDTYCWIRYRSWWGRGGRYSSWEAWMRAEPSLDMRYAERFDRVVSLTILQWRAHERAVRAAAEGALGIPPLARRAP